MQVRLSSHIKGKILESIMSMFAPRISPAHAAMLSPDNGVAAAIYNDLFSGTMITRINAASDLLPHLQQVLVTAQTYPYSRPYGKQLAVLTFKFHVAVPVPNDFVKLQSGWDADKHPKIADLPTAWALFQPLCAEYEKVASERHVLMSEVDKLLSHTHTVNQLVKVWPSVTNHLPKEAVAKLYEKRSTSTASQPTPVLAPFSDAAKTALVKAEMLKK